MSTTTILNWNGLKKIKLKVENSGLYGEGIKGTWQDALEEIGMKVTDPSWSYYEVDRHEYHGGNQHYWGTLPIWSTKENKSKLKGRCEMKKYMIWENPYREENEGGMLITAKKVEKAIDLVADRVYLIEGVDPDRAEELNAKAQELDVRVWSEYDIQEILEAAGVDLNGVYIRTAADYEDPDDILAYSTEVGYFGSLADYDTTRIYRWWDGRNWKVESEPEGVGYETEVVLSDSYVDLDEWDGRNHVTGGMGNHARVYRVMELDGEVPTEPTFLLNLWFQWQGVHQTGRVVTLDEIPDILRELDRDPGKYIPEISSISE